MSTSTSAVEQRNAFGRVIDVLEAIGATYAIWGGLAVVAYGEPRFTLDMDVLLSPSEFMPDLFCRRLHESNYHVDRQAVQKVLIEGGYFNVIDLHHHIKIDFYVPHHNLLLQQALRDRVYLPFDEMRRAAYVSVTSAIVSKLHAYAESSSTRHLDDIASMVRVQAGRINAAEIDVAAARLKVTGAWRQLWESNQPGP